MNALEPSSPHEMVVVIKAAQVGGSEAGLCFLGWAMSESQGPTMLVLPSRTAARAFSRKRITPLIDLSEDLQKKLISRRERDQNNSLMEKRFHGASLTISGCGSSTDLRSDPIRYLILEEVSAYPESVGDDGDPVELAINRTKSFRGIRKILMISTPKNRKTCRITRRWELSNQQHLHVPCPYCQHKQRLRWERLIYDEAAPDKAAYSCERCERQIEHSHKTWMLAGGEWVAEKPESRIAGFHLSALYSPIGMGDSWGDLARRYLEARRDTLSLKTFYNNELGLPWDDTEDAIDWQLLYARREQYGDGYVPDDVRLITVGVDVQKNYLAYEIVGWTRRKSSYSLDYDEITGDTNDPATWAKLGAMLSREFTNRHGTRLFIAKAGIDSGYRAHMVYDFLRTQDPSRIHAIDGRDQAGYIVSTPSHVDVDYQGRRIRSGLKIYPVGTHFIKSEIYAQMKLRPLEDGSLPAGYMHFPDHYGTEYFQQLTAEELKMTATRQGEVYTWVKIRRRNEALDCRVYARAMASLWGIDSAPASYWDGIEAEFTGGERPGRQGKKWAGVRDG